MLLFMVLWASLIFALVDYFGYNTIGVAKHLDLTIFKKVITFDLQKKILSLTPYRWCQIVLGAILAYLLYAGPGLLSVALCLVLYFTFFDDLLFYGLSEALQKFPNDKGVFQREVMGNQVVWAWWTVYGLIRGKRTEPIAGIILVLQSVIGLALVVAICVVL
jgi:hypothetical protein